jgi:putative phosphoesterase
MSGARCVVGVISDTHGLLRPQAMALLQGAERILHAGDVGNAAILAALAGIAPVDAIRGNNDDAQWAAGLPDTLALDIAGVPFYIVHDVKALGTRMPPRGTRIIICGHSHRPSVVDRDGMLIVNPGSAGPRRFSLPLSVARLTLCDGQIDARILPIALPDARASGKRA